MGGDVSTVEPGPPPAAVLRALQDLVEHPGLRLSERNRRFLDFVVRETVEGNGARIKAYAIGVDVFGRDQSFDPAVDPIVRIEANRIRSALAKYYENDGVGDRIRISMPAGTYVPTFTARAMEAANRPLPTREPRPGRSVVVRDRSGAVDRETVLRRDLFANAVMRSLGRLGFKVFWSPSESDAAAAKAVGDRLAAGQCFDVAVHLIGSKRRYSWRLWETQSGAVLLCDHRDIEARSAPCVDLIDAMAEAAVRDLASLAVNT